MTKDPILATLDLNLDVLYIIVTILQNIEVVHGYSKHDPDVTWSN